MNKLDTSRIDPIENYNKNWKHIVENPDGTLNKDQIMKELSDFSFMIDEVPKVYSEVTGGMLSKPMYYCSSVISAHEDYLERQREYRKVDDLQDGVCSLCLRQFTEDEIDNAQSDQDLIASKKSEQ